MRSRQTASGADERHAARQAQAAVSASRLLRLISSGNRKLLKQPPNPLRVADVQAMHRA